MNKVNPKVFKERVEFVARCGGMYSRHKICLMLGISKDDLWRYEQAAGVTIPRKNVGKAACGQALGLAKQRQERAHRDFLEKLPSFRWSGKIERAMNRKLFKMLNL